MTITDFSYFLLTICAGFAAFDLVQREMRRDLMMLQQNSYRNERYMRWLRESGDTTSMPRLCAMAIFLISLVGFSISWIGAALILVFSVIRSIDLARKKYKKPLVFTKRVTRLLCAEAIVELIILVSIGIAFQHNIDIWYYMSIGLIGLYCASHILLMAVNLALSPVEKHINRRFYNDARRRLEAMPDLKIVGVTGSYGKTSTKHYLERILSEEFQVRMTPGSFNTTLGVVRTIRENLKPYDEIFIVEMGAKQRGDIKEICDLVKPRIGIVTAVGPQHLESFKTIENVRDTKFELVDALPSDGLAIVNNDFPYIASRPVPDVACLRYAVTSPSGADFTARDITYSTEGTTFTVAGDGMELTLHTRLVGECNISNLLAAVIAALRLGMKPEKIKYSVAQIEPVEHRLSMKRTPGGVTILDDAFNSNPMGSAMALDVLSMMDKGKRIVVTPGMIELGERQAELNRDFGAKIGECADVAIIVGEYNRAAILEGLRATAGSIPKENIHAVDSFAEAQKMLGGILAPGDTVLYENDLPDTFK